VSYTKIAYSAAGGVAEIELNDPPANTYSYEMMREIDDAVLAARMAAEVHVIVIRGAGEKFFCAGANITMLAGTEPSWKYYFCLHANETMNRLERELQQRLFESADATEGLRANLEKRAPRFEGR
jgi:enoyl-CoA hydratase/carnithine racemase